MKISILNFRDMSGNGYNLAEALNRLTSHEAVSIRLQNNFFNYRTHMELKDCVGNVANPVFDYDNASFDAIQRTIYDSDVIVVREFFELFDWLKLDVSKIRRKRIVFTFGGWRFRKPEWRQKTFDHFNGWNVKWMTTSADFIKDFDGTFVPCCIPMDEYRAKYNFRKRDPPLMLHTPSSSWTFERSNKAFEYAVAALADQFKFDADILFDLPNDECLRQKAPASIFFDRLEYLYGVNSVEAACFEAAVLTWTSRETLDELEAHAEMKCPFIIVEDRVELYEELRWRLPIPNHITELGKECYRYVKQLHDGRYSVKQLLEMIE